MESVPVKERIFTPYQIFVIAILTFLQFTIILDFMVLSPLGVILIEEFHITPAQFTWVVSAYAVSAGISGLLASIVADMFDRKKFLIFFYVGFIVGTLMCAIATTYEALFIARIVTGIFGGVISAIGFAIITDLFPVEKRGRVMGFTQMAFASSQILGIPIGFYMANALGWHTPFWLIVGISAVVGIFIVIYLKPINAHLKLQSDKWGIFHMWKIITTPRYLGAFGATALLATGGYMLMPLGTTFSVHNLGLTEDQIPILYAVSGIFSLALGPLIGILSDKIGKYPVFVAGSILGAIMVVIYCNLEITPLWIVIALNILLFAGILARMVPAGALLSVVPAPADRGSFMGINSAIQQIAGGISALIAGFIVIKPEHGKLLHYDTLGYVVVGTMAITGVMMYFINQMVNRIMAKPPAAPIQQP